MKSSIRYRSLRKNDINTLVLGFRVSAFTSLTSSSCGFVSLTGLVSKTTTNDGCCVLEFEEQDGALLTHIFFPTIRVVLSDVGGFEQSSPARRNNRVFLGFENSNFKPLSAQGERVQFPRVDGFSSGRRGVAEAVFISFFKVRFRAE